MSKYQENTQETFSLTTSQENCVPAAPGSTSYQDVLDEDFYFTLNQNSSFNSNTGTGSSAGVNGLPSFDSSLEDLIRRVVTEVISKDLKYVIQSTVKDTINEALTNVGNSNLASLSRRAAIDKEIKGVQEFILKTYTADYVTYMINNPNQYGVRTQDINSDIKSYKKKILDACDRYYKIQDVSNVVTPEELADKYTYTYATLKQFVRAQVVFGKNESFKWSDLDGETQKLYRYMAEDYVVKTLGEDGLPLFCFMDSWGARMLLIALIRNTTPRRSQKKYASGNINIEPLNSLPPVDTGLWANSVSVENNRLKSRENIIFLDEDDIESDDEDEAEVENDEEDSDGEDQEALYQEAAKLVARYKAKKSTTPKKRSKAKSSKLSKKDKRAKK